MSAFTSCLVTHRITELLTAYDKVMLLKIYCDFTDLELFDKYQNMVSAINNKLVYIHGVKTININELDAGFDLLVVACEQNEGTSTKQLSLDSGICAAAYMYSRDINGTISNKTYPTGFYMYPRSSISKTPFRLANSVGIIDAGYRGHLIAKVDVRLDKNADNDYVPVPTKGERLFQICAPGLVPIVVELVSTKEELGITERGDGGFGSTTI